MSSSESRRATNDVSCEEDLACEQYAMLCKASMDLKETWDYSVIYILIKQIQQVFKNLLFMKLFASTTTWKFLGVLPKNGLSNTALHECGVIRSSKGKRTDLTGAPSL